MTASLKSPPLGKSYPCRAQQGRRDFDLCQPERNLNVSFSHASMNACGRYEACLVEMCMRTEQLLSSMYGAYTRHSLECPWSTLPLFQLALPSSWILLGNWVTKWSMTRMVRFEVVSDFVLGMEDYMAIQADPSPRPITTTLPFWSWS